MNDKISIGSDKKLTIEDCVNVLKGRKIELSRDATEKIERCNVFLETNSKIFDEVTSRIKNGPKLTEAGQDAGKKIMQKQQENLIKSLYSGMGSPVHRDVVKITMLLQAHALAQGCSGVSLKSIAKLLEWIHTDACPEIYRFGSTGNDGNRVQLSSIASAMIGESININHEGRVISATAVPIGIYTLQNREGPALTNGLSFTKAIVTVTYGKLAELFSTMLDLFGMTLEVLQVNWKPFESIAQGKVQNGQKSVALHVLKFLKKHSGQKENGYLFNSYNEQLFLSFPQEIGLFFENFQRCKELLETEINSLDDDVIIDAESNSVTPMMSSSAYLTEISDTFKMNTALASSWIYSLQKSMCDPAKSHGLPENLMENNNASNGFSRLVDLSKALAEENSKLAASNNVPSLDSESERMNGSGLQSAFDFETSVGNLEFLCATLYLSVSQAWEFRDPQPMSDISARYQLAIREVVSKRKEDKAFKADLDTVLSLLRGTAKTSIY